MLVIRWEKFARPDIKKQVEAALQKSQPLLGLVDRGNWERAEGRLQTVYLCMRMHGVSPYLANIFSEQLSGM